MAHVRYVLFQFPYLEALATPEGPATPGRLYNKLMFLASFLSQAASLKFCKENRKYIVLGDYSKVQQICTLFEKQKKKEGIFLILNCKVGEESFGYCPIEDLTEIQDNILKFTMEREIFAN